MSSSSSPSAVVFVVVADGEATIDPTKMGIETALTEFLDAVVVPDDYRYRNSNNIDDE